MHPRRRLRSDDEFRSHRVKALPLSGNAVALLVEWLLGGSVTPGALRTLPKISHRPQRAVDLKDGLIGCGERDDSRVLRAKPDLQALE
jgi:hypothetical protein